MNRWAMALRAWLVFSVLGVTNWPQVIEAVTVQSRRSLADASSHAAFMEYIGGGNAGLSDVPVVDSSAFDFHFLLAFATDPSLTEGLFNATWQPRLSPANISAIKTLHPNIKFSCSVGGGGDAPSVTFNPSNLTTWVKNAVASLSHIISTYHLDGIDIDFESFGTSTEEFASGIGQLFTQLKQEKLISFATIAPYPGTDSFYTELWSSYNKTIDYVNYQMYSGGDMSVSEYVSFYSQAKSMYTGGTVLASFETVNQGTVIIPSSGLDGCKQLKEKGELDGIFIWSADQSYNNFQFEREAQALLKGLSPSPSPSPSPSSSPAPIPFPPSPHSQPTPSGPSHSPNSAPAPPSDSVPPISSHGTRITLLSQKQSHTLFLLILVTMGYLLYVPFW